MVASVVFQWVRACHTVILLAGNIQHLFIQHISRILPVDPTTPEALRSAHDEIIDMRNKRYAHVADHDSVNDEMEIQEDEGRFIVNLSFRFGFYIGGSNDWTKLVDALDEIFAERGQKIVERLQARTGREWSIAQGPPPDATPT